MDLFQRHLRVSVDSFVNPIETKLTSAKTRASSPTVDLSSRQPCENNSSFSLDIQSFEEQKYSTSPCECNSDRAEAPDSRINTLFEEASPEAQNTMIEEPFVQELLAKERNDAKEQSFGLSFLVTDTQGREEDYFGNRDTGKCSKTSLSKYPLQEETIPGSSNLSGRNKKRCNARGYKSLSLLCENFIKLYGNHTNEEFFIDEVAEVLNVERRRIYDIVNVLESIGIVVKKKRNHYKWQGVDRIPFTLIALKVSSQVENELRQQSTSTMEAVESLSCSSDEDSLSSRKDEELGRETGLLRHRNDQNDKFLGVLTQRFIKLFLESNERIVSFQEITRSLLGEQDKDVKSKTGVRRLYDIANILSALQLIQKTQNQNGEMAYQWLLSEITYLHTFSSTKMHGEESFVSRKRDISSFQEKHEKQKLPRTIEPGGLSSNLISRDNEVENSNEKVETALGETFPEVNSREQIEACSDWHTKAADQLGAIDVSREFASAYGNRSISVSDRCSENHSTIQFRTCLAEFQRSVIQQWYQWFEQLPATTKIESNEIIGNVPKTYETSEVFPKNFLSIPLYWSQIPFESTSKPSLGSNNDIDGDETKQR